MARFGFCSDMLPRFVFANPADSWNTEVELHRNSFQFPSALAQGTNRYNIGFANFCSMVLGALYGWAAQHPIPMKVIFRTRTIFNIFEAVVCLISIYMINLMSSRNRANESGENQSMHSILLTVSFLIEHYLNVAFLYCSKMFTENSFPAIRPRGYAFDIAKATDFIDIFIPNYGFPSFIHRKYSMSCLFGCQAVLGVEIG